MFQFGHRKKMSFVNIVIVLIISTFWISNSHSAVTDFKCTSSGYFRNPKDCTRFHVCVDLTGIRARGIFRKYNFNCPVGTVFDEGLSVCNYVHAAPPCENGGAGKPNLRFPNGRPAPARPRPNNRPRNRPNNRPRNRPTNSRPSRVKNNKVGNTVG